MIKITINELLNSTDVLQKLSKTDLKARLSWQIARLLKAADTEIQSFNDARMNLVRKFGEKDENGELITDEQNNCKIPNDSTIEFSNELNELINTEIEINANKIKIEDIENLNFTPAEMNTLESFIDFSEE